MDGNRRWAKERGLPAIEGHRRGMVALRHVTRAARDLGIEVLTVYGFSTENWNRAASEISLLFELCVHFARTELIELRRNNVRVRVIGDWESLPAAPRAALADLQAGTAGNTGLLLNLAVNYSSHDELERAVRAIARDVARGTLHPEAIDDDVIRTVSLHRRAAGARSADPARRRAPAFELSAVSSGLCGARDVRRVLAGFLEGRSRAGARGVCAARAALRRSLNLAADRRRPDRCGDRVLLRRFPVGVLRAGAGDRTGQHLRVQLPLRDQGPAAGVSGGGAGRRRLRRDGGLRRLAQLGRRAAGRHRRSPRSRSACTASRKATSRALPTRCSRSSTSASCSRISSSFARFRATACG